MHAWSLVLHGREDEVPELHGVDTDPLATLGTAPTEKYQHAEKQLSIWQMTIWGLRYLSNKLWNPRQVEESRTVFIPATYVESLRETALSDIKQSGRNLGDVPFLSEGDVICAWWTRQLVRAQISEHSSQTIAINNAFGMRWLLGEDLLPSSRAYIGNAFCMIPAFLSATDVLKKPLGLVAASIRQALVNLGTRQQVEAVAALNRASQDNGGVALFGDPWMHMIVCTNWTKADLFSSDFSGALVGESRHAGSQQCGRPSFIFAHAFAEGFSMINGFMITGRDVHGNVWLHGILRSEVWPAIEQRIGGMA